MLLKYSGACKFIFIANTKSASNSLESSKLAAISDIRITNAYAGKHMSIEQVHERFEFLFGYFPFEDFFKFGVIRDPLDWVISWYNFRSRPSLKRKEDRSGNYAGDLAFNEFWQLNKTADFLTPQKDRFFSSMHEHIKVDYLIRQDNLERDLIEVQKLLGLSKLNIPNKNRSLNRVKRGDIEDLVREDIYTTYKDDYELIENLPAFNAQGFDKFQNQILSSKSLGTEGIFQLGLGEILSEAIYRLRVGLKRK
jgi:hypothetical protein